MRAAPKTVLCFGDSNTHGTPPMSGLGASGRLKAHERWPGIVRERLGRGWVIVEEGLPGRTTVHDDPIEGAYKNGALGLEIALHTHKPVDLLLIMLGTNDLKMRFSKPASDIALSIEKLVTIAKASLAGPAGSAPAIILISPPPILEAGVLATMFTGGAEKSLSLALDYAEVAERQGCGFLEAGQYIESSAVDGIHFDAAQHQSLGEAIAAVIGDKYG